MILSLTPGSTAHEFACHSKACAPPPAGHGGSLGGGSKRTKVSPSDATGITPRKTRDYNVNLGPQKYRASADRAHTKAFISRLLGREIYAKSKGHGPTRPKTKTTNPRPVGYKAKDGLTREQARAMGAFK